MSEVQLKAGNYGKAIALLLRNGGGFQTRFERTLIINQDQRRLLEEAGLVEKTIQNGQSRKSRGKKAQ
jgi:hypothetical protein